MLGKREGFPIELVLKLLDLDMILELFIEQQVQVLNVKITNGFCYSWSLSQYNLRT